MTNARLPSSDVGDDSTDVALCGVEVLPYEARLAEDSFFHSEVVRDLDEFKRRFDVIVANPRTPDITGVADKVYTRDLFGSG